VGAWVRGWVGWCGVGAVPSFESRRVASAPQSASEMETSGLLASKEQQEHQGVTDVRSQLIVLLCFVDWLGGDLSTRNAVEHGVAPVRKHVRCDEGLVEKVAHTFHRCVGVCGEVLVPERRE